MRSDQESKKFYSNQKSKKPLLVGSKFHNDSDSCRRVHSLAGVNDSIAANPVTLPLSIMSGWALPHWWAAATGLSQPDAVDSEGYVSFTSSFAFILCSVPCHAEWDVRRSSNICPKQGFHRALSSLVLSTSRDGDSSTFLDSVPTFDHCHGKQKNE